MLLKKEIIATPNLWKHSSIFNIEQLEISPTSFSDQPISDQLRLGMYVEQVIFQSLESYPNLEILAKNVQIIENNITIGEIDCLYRQHDICTHLEIVYKFYLFDPKKSLNELSCWIGPNRKDSLIEKLNKLKEKQFPLLYQPQTKKVLSQLNIDSEKIVQKVCFKAQLYVPFNHVKEKFELINSNCLVGYYYRLNELEYLKDCKFYIPSKLNWIKRPTQHLNWINSSMFLDEVQLLLNEKRSPLCFVKDKKGNLSKIFVVWWD